MRTVSPLSVEEMTRVPVVVQKFYGEVSDMAIGDEYVIGYIPGRDGSGYRPNLPTPTWARVTQTINNNALKRFTVIVIGIIYPGENPNGFSFSSTNIDMSRGLRTIAERFYGRKTSLQEEVGIAQDPAFTGEIVTEIGGFPNPTHITAIVLRQLP